MEVRGIMSPKRSHFSPKITKKPTDPEVKKSAKKHPKKVDASKIQVTTIAKAATFPNSSKPKPQVAATNPNPKGNKTNFSPEPSSPVPPPTPTPIPTRKKKSQPTTPSSSSKINVVRRIDNDNFPKASPKISPTSGSDHRQKDFKTTADPNSPASSHSFIDIGDRLLQRLSFDGKELEDILEGNSIDELMGSNNKKEESSPRSLRSLAILQIYQNIASHRQENLSVERYFKKLKKLWDDIATYSRDFAQGYSSNGTIEFWNELTERDKVMQFFVGLNDNYSIICSQILVKHPFPTLEEAYSEIIREEKRRELVVALGTVAAKLIQSNRLLSNQNGPSNNGDDKNL